MLGGTALIAAHAARYGNWIVDDAAITFAYARSLADGVGPVLQPGATPVEGFSNPAWLALLSGGRLLGLFDRGSLLGIPDYVLFPKALALLCCAGILLGCYVAARDVTRRPWLVTLITGAVLAAIPSFVIWSFSGLENSLFALAVFWLAVVIFRAVLADRLLSTKVAVGAGLLVTLAALTRPDGIIYLAAYPLVVLIMLRRPDWPRSVRSILLATGAFAIPYGAYLAWRLAEFGQWLSSPAIAKHQTVPDLDHLARVGQVVQYAGALGVLVVAGCVGMVLARPSRMRCGLIALLVPLMLALVAFAVLVPDWMGELRFATPIWSLAAFLGTLATCRVLQRAGIRGRSVLSLGLVVALLPTADAFLAAADRFRAVPTVPMCLVVERFGRTFNGYLDIIGADRASLLAPDIGGTAMTSRLTLFDLAGLAEPRIAEFVGANDMLGLRNYVFDDVKPTFIHAHVPWSTSTGVTADPRLDRDYHPIFLYPDNPHNGDWVRKDAVRDAAQVQGLRELRDHRDAAGRRDGRWISPWPVRTHSSRWPASQAPQPLRTKTRPGGLLFGGRKDA